MKKYIISVITLFLLPVVHAQNPPDWTQSANRERSYPSSEWYTGFAFDQLKPGANASAALEVLKKNAQNEMAGKIISNVKSTTDMTTHRTVVGGVEEIKKDYQQSLQIATSATTVKTEVKTFHNTTTGELFAFAAVRQADLAAYYRRQINLDLSKAETAVAVSEQLAESGKKMSARRKVEEARKNLVDVYSCADLLAAVSTGRDDSDMQISRAGELMRTVERLLINLERSTFVYMDCRYEKRSAKDDAFSDDPGILCDIIAQMLNENECSLTDSRDEADYILTLITSTTQRSDGKTGINPILSYYANARGNLYNRATQRQVVTFTIFNDADCYEAGRDAQDAATKAFKLPDLKNKVMDKILPVIKN